ncbi:alpha/beta hydrolase fold protein [Ferroglobus placidus DSM 10642]|uniref:Alpha/beta hydrolase fold protein n=1 Tax=Ferroglobus placidus (strain DSM 10642 / AEDII12DO) TaxID=589924 RepID=D3RX60_FERPA|nr:alpha/beta fold hydrolase [Ferroglobus placidus]ADC65073.1 alpha/beta hydrolase fold protein [Ferroglobus placidus DSM 10642]
MELRFGFFDSNGLKLRYFEVGKGEPLILIHGLGESLEGWTFQYSEFARKYRVVSLDLRGFGMSDIPEKISVRDFAEDVKNLMDFLKIDAAHLLGLSMGGVVCFEFYKNYPERVKSLVLANTLHKLPEEAKPLFEERLKLLERGSMEEIAEFIANISFHQKRRELIDLVKTIIRKNDKEYYTKVTIEIGKINYEDLLPKIAVPTLVIVAEFDITTPPELGEQIAKLIPNSTLKVVKNAAHLAKMENPEEFNRFVLEFLEGLER